VWERLCYEVEKDGPKNFKQHRLFSELFHKKLKVQAHFPQFPKRIKKLIKKLIKKSSENFKNESKTNWHACTDINFMY
jgi:hypothetical protein